MNKFTRSKRPKEERIKQQTRESEPNACRIQDICLIIEFFVKWFSSKVYDVIRIQCLQFERLGDDIQGMFV